MIPAKHKYKKIWLFDANKKHTRNRYTHLHKRTFRRRFLRGSMTVEASIIIPMVFLVWVACIGWTSLVRIHTSVQEMLVETARELAIAAGTSKQLVDDMGYIYTWSQQLQMSEFEVGIVDSIYNVNVLDSRILEDNDEILLKVNYSVRLLEGLVPLPAFKMSNQVYARAWTGEQIADTQGNTDFSNMQVFVSEYGHVYHTDQMCSYIHLTIFHVEEKEAKKYEPCDKCVNYESNNGQNYYITETGEHYHKLLGCSGLKRQVDTIVMTEAQTMGYRPCSRCSGGM